MNALDFTFKATIGLCIATVILRVVTRLFPVLDWKYEAQVAYSFLVLIVVCWLIIGHFWP